MSVMIQRGTIRFITSNLFLCYFFRENTGCLFAQLMKLLKIIRLPCLMYRKKIHDIEYNNVHFKTSHNVFFYI